ncbi:MAG: hypothetical protein V5B34_16935 [Accumulibacter sp.]|jgi:hypothetical protein
MDARFGRSVDHQLAAVRFQPQDLLVRRGCLAVERSDPVTVDDDLAGAQHAEVEDAVDPPVLSGLDGSLERSV